MRRSNHAVVVGLTLLSAVQLAVSGCRSTPRGVTVDPCGGEVIVFVQRGASAVDRTFQRDRLPQIRAIAEELGAALRVVDARHGAPAEVSLTPLIVYQNHRGRSIYQGRYSTVDRIRNFLRTARVAPQSDTPLVRRGVPVMQAGRARIAAPLKIASVDGHKPDGFDRAEFETQARGAIATGFKKFRATDRVELRRSDRMFYMDFYPWLSQSGELYLSLRLYSQFHCKKPIFSTGDAPLRGPWSQRERLFAQAAAQLEAAVLSLTGEPDVGDGFDPIPASRPVISWEEIGLALPPPPEDGAAPAITGKPLVRSWRVATPEPGAPPQIQFRFAPPFEAYSGEATSAGGELHLTSQLGFIGGRGRFTAETAGVTMGEPDLDDALRSSIMLNVSRYPSSSFTVEKFESDHDTLAYGRAAPVIMHGRFRLKGVTIPISVRAIFEPIVDESGEPRLLMQASFQLNITPFDLEGPDGDPPASETMLFDINMVLEPLGSSS